ncbi:MAG TPA: 16S rRNA (guanine(966)-N(2))-methyltransferase RsmD [Phycisphaerae bacterium]|nr:16S rRNA (guanine(966)-N(2))-methyltransferase RsmD [Phycisphaerae bacterium]
MRVIAGQYRRRKLLAPAGLNTRPILDRVKTALFDWLGAKLAMPGRLPPLKILDLFSGGGSLGIEALSRGGEFCAFVENESEAMRCLLQNLDALQIGPAARFYHGAAETIRISPPPGGAFDLVFFDPPYLLSETTDPGGAASRILARLGTEIPVSDKAMLVWRHDSSLTLPQEVSGWNMDEQRTWGGMTVSIFHRGPSEKV